MHQQLFYIFCILFVVFHIVLSIHSIRSFLINKLGEKAFSGIFSLLALVTLVAAIFLYIKYNVKENEFEVATNAKDPKKLVLEYIRSQIGQGTDNVESTKLDMYHIIINLDLSYDVFTVSHDCGNKGLRDGILIHYTQQDDAC